VIKVLNQELNFKREQDIQNIRFLPNDIRAKIPKNEKKMFVIGFIEFIRIFEELHILVGSQYKV